MQGADTGIQQELDGLGLHIGIVQARFNEDITNALAVACIQELEALGVHDIDHVLVPGVTGEHVFAVPTRVVLRRSVDIHPA